MNILHLHDESWDSGLAHYALTAAAALRDKGHDVQFWAAYRSDAAKQARAMGLVTRELARAWSALPALRQAVKSADIELINAHTGSSHSLAAALAMGRRVAVVRTWADARLPETSFGRKFLARRTALFIGANSPITAALAAAFPFVRARRVLPGIPDFPAELKAPPREPVIGILGRLDAVKGHDDVLDAAAIVCQQYPKAIFLAAGEDKGDRLSKLRWQADFLGLGQKLKFLGRVQDAAQFMDGCSLGLVASRGSEAVSRAALEWMARGRPVIATRVGGLPDVVAHGETGLLIPPRDPKTMAKAVAGLVADPAFCRRAGENGRTRFLERFCQDAFALATEDAYEDALGHLPH
ncbi:MAG TPA: glycosyltransferase family 4 protein [Elusimicrobiota bacterium]|nr:glycosyltransferase family 4 protein [Elusimicrobiota bacterium]